MASGRESNGEGDRDGARDGRRPEGLGGHWENARLGGFSWAWKSLNYPALPGRQTPQGRLRAGA